mgnify:CR=1 FL=1
MLNSHANLKDTIMKRLTVILAMALIAISAGAQTPKNVKYAYTEASDLNLIGKIIDTPNPYHRVDTVRYKGFTKGENEQVRSSAGLAVLFKTNSSVISVLADYGYMNRATNTMGISLRGYDLYIKKDGEWVFAGVGRPEMADGPAYDSHEGTIVKSMAPGRKECLMYLPLYDRLDSLFIGVEEGSYVEPLENPFKYRIVVKGSSVTHGLAASRPGMSYAARFGRDNGLYCFNLGFSGKSKLQEEYARYLADIEDVDAFIFDAFSNPSAEVIHENFDRFVDIIRAAHPQTPLIFMQTERRESRNFDTWREDFEATKQAAAEEEIRERMTLYRYGWLIWTSRLRRSSQRPCVRDWNIPYSDTQHSLRTIGRQCRDGFPTIMAGMWNVSG